MQLPPESMIRSVAELESMFPAPMNTSVVKETEHLTPSYRRFIEEAPFLAMATSGTGGLDCSPRGDPPGFVRVADLRTLLLPERRGNHRLDTLRNLVEDPRAALLFLIPGVTETLRVNGVAELTRDRELCESFSVSGKAPQIVIVFHIRSVYFQCARALVRSRLWSPESLRSPRELPTAGMMLADASGGVEGGADYDAVLPERIRTTLY